MKISHKEAKSRRKALELILFIIPSLTIFASHLLMLFFMKKNIIPSFLLILGILLFFHSCSSESQSNTEKIFAHLNVRYLQPDQQVKAEAHFSKGIDKEKAKPLKIENGVIFQGKKMTAKEISNGEVRYNLAERTDFSDEFKFSFPSSKLLSTEIVSKMNPLDELVIHGEFIKSKDVQFSWKGKPLSKNESLVFLFNNEKNNFVSFEIDGPTNSSSINIPSEKFKKLPEGKGKIYFIRKQSNITEKSNTTFLSETEFYSRVINVTILP